MAAVGFAAVAAAAGIATPAVAGTSLPAKSSPVAITIDGRGLGGQPVSIPSNQAGMWSLSAPSTAQDPIYASSDGRFHVLPGTYLVGGYVPVSNGNHQNALVIRRVKIRKKGTITLDAKGAKRFIVGLTGAAGATDEGQFADVCVRGGSGRHAWALSFLPSYVTPGGSQYMKPLAIGNIVLVYHAVYSGTSGEVYDIAGARAGGLPANPRFSASTAGLSRVTIAARSGTEIGSSFTAFLSWQYGKANCGADFTPDGSPLTLPGEVTQYVSPGQLATGALASSTDGSALFESIHALAGHSYTATFYNAVAGPNRGTPVLSQGLLCSESGALYGDPLAGGWQSDASGTVHLKRGDHALGRRAFGLNSCFRIGRKTGWFTMTETGRRAKAPTGVTPASLSTSISVAWHFRVPTLSALQYLNAVQMPLTLMTFAPRGLNAQNEVPPGQTRIVLHVIRNGGYGASMALRYALRSVRVQYSVDGGNSWQSASVTANSRYWVVTIRSLGAHVSLRSTVTDVKGDSTVETIENAYGVS